MNIEKRALADLSPAPYNPRKDLKPGDPEFEKLKRSIEAFGYVEPIIVNDRTGKIVGGHQRLKVLQAMGETEAECVIVDLSETEEKALNIALNKVNGDWDEDKLEALMRELEASAADITLTGFDARELEKMFGVDVTVKEDTPPKIQEETDTQVGDLFILGEHRVLCGDSTKPETIRKLMDGQKADLLLTDPPYNVSLGQDSGHPVRPSEAKQLHRRTDGLVIANDAWNTDEEFVDFLVQAYKAALEAIKPGGVFYIWHADTQKLNFLRACEKAGMTIRQNLVWVKNIFAMGRQDYQWQHEPCLYGWTEGAAHYFTAERDHSTVWDDYEDINKLTAAEAKRMLKEILNGDTPTTILRENKPQRSAEHPTMKPVKLMAKQIRNSTKPGEIVLDIFAGSGSTLMAAEQLKRRAFCVEYDPHYCDVIVKRWEKFTGQKAQKITEEKK